MMRFTEQLVPYNLLNEYVESCNDVFGTNKFYSWEMINDYEANILSRDGNHLRVRVVQAPFQS